MTERVCYISRTDRGGAVTGLRLVGVHTDDLWSASNGAAPSPGEDCRAGARWLRDRLDASANGSGRTLRLLCLDVDGSVCSWVTAPRAEASLVRAVIERDSADLDGDEMPGPEGSRFPDLPGETDVEPLAEETGGPRRGLSLRRHAAPGHGAGRGRRMAVLSVPDVPARLLLDELDRLGVGVGRVVSLWHAMAQVWDPGARSETGGVRGDRVVADAIPTAAIVLVDPASGRLVWSWSLRGALIAAGSMSVPMLHEVKDDVHHGAGEGGELARRVESPAEPRAQVGPEQIARLAAEWLTWSAQVGQAPGRVVWIAPEARLADGRTVGAALAHAWPEATVDAIEEADPVGATLRRLADGVAGKGPEGAAPSRTGLSSLSNRPGRAHRALFVWSAAALAALAVVVGFIGVRERAAAARLESAAAEARQNRNELLEAVDRSLIVSPFPERELETRVAERRSRLGPPEQFERPKPILDELETLTLVLGAPSIEIRELTLSSTLVNVRATVQDTAAAEELWAAVRAVGGSELTWSQPTFRQTGDGRVECTLVGEWARRPAGGTS